MDTAPRTPMQAACPASVRVPGRPSALSVVADDWPEGHRRSMPTREELTDLLLAVAARSDRQAFAILFKHFAPRIKSYLMRAGCPEAAAEELAQEAMVNVWRRAATFDPARAQPSTWIFTIARNLRVDRLRRDSPAADHETALDAAHEQIASGDATAEEQLCAARRERSVRLALARLPAAEATLVRLSFYDDQPHAQIASELRIPLGTVKSRMRRAIAHLRRLLDTIESP